MTPSKSTPTTGSRPALNGRLPFAQVWLAIESVEGWLSRDQAFRLYEAASRVPSGGRIVEIGSYRGRSAIVEALATDSTVEIVAIDPHGGNDRGPQQWEGTVDDGQLDHQAFLANLERAGVRHRIRHIRRFSTDAFAEVVGPVDLLYVDGAHSFGPARADIVQWGARVTEGATMLVHDAYSCVGVTAALLTSMLPSRRWRYQGRSRSMTEYQRVELSPAHVLANSARQLMPLGWFARNLAVKALISAGFGRFAKVLGHDGVSWPY